MSLLGLGCAKTKSDLVVMPSGRQIFMFFCSPHDHRAQNSGYGYTAWSFYTARVMNVILSGRRPCPLFLRSLLNRCIATSDVQDQSRIKLTASTTTPCITVILGTVR